jgi:uncharacterized UPF0146 family protein
MHRDLPPQMVARLAKARKVLEVGAGSDFSTALAVQAAAPHATVLVSDVDPRVMRAPAPLVPLLLDVHAPDVRALAGVDLVFAVRVPEELQASCVALAQALGADLAMRALKDEWAHLDGSPAVARPLVWGGGWRCFVLLRDADASTGTKKARRAHRRPCGSRS